MSVNIERASREDAAAVLALLAASGLPQDGVVDHLETAFVARDGEHVVGCVALEIYEDGALLRSVAVSVDARGTGLGERLVRAALAFGDQRHVSAVYLLTTTAEQFFPRFGFERVTRGDVPAGVLGSVEFQGVCGTSAVVMRRVATLSDAASSRSPA